MSEQQRWYLIVIDPSLNQSGYAVYMIDSKHRNPVILAMSVINNAHFVTKEIGKKLANIEMEFTRLRNAYYPCVVVKEELVLKTLPKGGVDPSVAILAKVHGIVDKVFIGCDIHDVNNKEFKYIFTNYGDSSKKKVEEACMPYEESVRMESYKSPTFNFRADDESDAVGIGLHWLIEHGYIKKK